MAKRRGELSLRTLELAKVKGAQLVRIVKQIGAYIAVQSNELVDALF